MTGWPVASVGNEAQAIPLTLVVSDRETVDELLQRAEARERDEYALAALQIGVLSLTPNAVRREGERLLVDLKNALDQSRNEIHSNLTTALSEYFDPTSGRFQERVERLITNGRLRLTLQMRLAMLCKSSHWTKRIWL